MAETAVSNYEEDDCFLYLLSGDNFDAGDFKNLPDSCHMMNVSRAKMSLKVRRLLQYFGDTKLSKEIIIVAGNVLRETPRCEVRELPLDPNTPRAIAPRKGLFATTDIKAQDFVLVSVEAYLALPEEVGRNVRGLVLPNIILYRGLKHDFTYFEIVEVPSSRKRRRTSSSNERPPPAKKEKRTEKLKNDDEEEDVNIFDKYIMCIDLRMADEKARAIRRHCQPNCVIQYVLLDQRMEIFVTTTREVKQGEELTIEHDFDYYFSNKMLQCAHPYDPQNPCDFEKNRRATIKRYVEQVELYRKTSASNQE